MTRQAKETPLGIQRSATCLCCGAPWTGAWMGVKPLTVCGRCAVEVLPKVIADATAHSQRTRVIADRTWADASAAYWRAIAIRGLASGR